MVANFLASFISLFRVLFYFILLSFFLDSVRFLSLIIASERIGKSLFHLNLRNEEHHVTRKPRDAYVFYRHFFFFFSGIHILYCLFLEGKKFFKVIDISKDYRVYFQRIYNTYTHIHIHTHTHVQKKKKVTKKKKKNGKNDESPRKSSNREDRVLLYRIFQG